jgi:hypothetical protein
MVKHLLLWLSALAWLSACAAVPAAPDGAGQGQGAQVAIVGVTVVPRQASPRSCRSHGADPRRANIRDRAAYSASGPFRRASDRRQGRYLMPGSPTLTSISNMSNGPTY